MICFIEAGTPVIRLGKQAAISDIFNLLLRHFGGHGTFAVAVTSDFPVGALRNAVVAVLAGELKGAVGVSTTSLAVATDLRFQIGLNRSKIVQGLAIPTGFINCFIGAIPLRLEFCRPSAFLVSESASAFDGSYFGALACSFGLCGKERRNSQARN